MNDIKTFADLWLSAPILKAVEKKGYINPSPIQAWVIPIFLNSEKDIIGQAQTGTGKTAAFWLPLLEKIDKRKKHIQAIILTPTRELAIQVADEINSFATAKSVDIALLYGGQNIGLELRNLRNSPQIVVWTPGRVQDHLRKKSLVIDKVDYFILDEADEMLNVWFREEIDIILESAPEKKRVLLFSATMPKAIKDIVNNYMWEYELVSVKKEEMTNKNIEQKCYKVTEKDKFDALCRVIDLEEEFYGIIFCRMKADVDEVASNLVSKWYSAEWIHWDVEQKWREKVLNRFKTKKIKILVATDVAARWIDVNDLTHVVNYSLPDNPETYTHRIWRTWRAWKNWVAISFVSRRDSRTLFFIERVIKQKITEEKLPDASLIIDKKRKKLISDTSEKLANDDVEKYKDLARKLLELWDAEDVLASVLSGAYWSVFDEANYKDIHEVSVSTREWKTRLFIAKWRNHGFDVIWIKKLIESETWLDLRWVRDVSLFWDFSFITLNSEDAELILATFKKLNKMKPLVVQAKERSGDDKGWFSKNRFSWNKFWNRGWFRKDGERNVFRRDRWFRDKRG